MTHTRRQPYPTCQSRRAIHDHYAPGFRQDLQKLSSMRADRSEARSPPITSCVKRRRAGGSPPGVPARYRFLRSPLQCLIGAILPLIPVNVKGVVQMLRLCNGCAGRGLSAPPRSGRLRSFIPTQPSMHATLVGSIDPPLSWRAAPFALLWLYRVVAARR